MTLTKVSQVTSVVRWLLLRALAVTKSASMKKIDQFSDNGFHNHWFQIFVTKWNPPIDD